jgi:hypothetical protein
MELAERSIARHMQVWVSENGREVNRGEVIGVVPKARGGRDIVTIRNPLTGDTVEYHYAEGTWHHAFPATNGSLPPIDFKHQFEIKPL